MAWHLQCWLLYKATEPSFPGDALFSSPGASWCVPMTRKSASSSSHAVQSSTPVQEEGQVVSKESP